MALTIKAFNELHDYLNKVIDRSHHHANNVDEVVLPLIGAVLWRADTEILVREQDGETKNVLWFTVGSDRYVFRYNHTKQCIDLLKDSLQGKLLHSFDNSSTVTGIKHIFSTL
jgi:hypothetical protein